jgi:GT2 family glycosyltransferase
MKLCYFNNFFDKNLFLYGEDFELSKRKFNEGYKNIVVKKSLVYHAEQLSTKIDGKSSEYKMLFFRNWHMGWGKAYLERKKKPYFKVCFKALQKLLSSIGCVVRLNKVNFIKYIAVFCGMISNLIGLNCFNKNNKNCKRSTNIII